MLRIPANACLAACLMILAGCGNSKYEVSPKRVSREEQPATAPAPAPKDGGSGSPDVSYSPRLYSKRHAAKKRKESRRPATYGAPKRAPSSVGSAIGGAPGGLIGGVHGYVMEYPPPPPRVKPSTVNLTWNAWAQAPGARFVPPDHLHPDRDYELVVDLSAISYKLAGGGRSKAVGPGTDRWIQQLLKDATREEAIFKVLILPDPAYYDHPVKRAATLSFKLDRLKDAKALLADAGDDAMAALRAQPEASFRLGHLTFPIHTTELQGMGSIGISFWADNRPVDEMVITYCIGTDAGVAQCKPSMRGTVSLNGLDSVRLSTEDAGKERLPDAAIHLVRLDSDQVLGVFRRNTWDADRFETWRLKRTAAGLRSYFADTLLPAFGAAVTEAQLQARGLDLLNLLFPEPGPNDAPETGVARAEFLAFVRDHLDGDSPSQLEHTQPPSIFVRMLTQDDNSLEVLPLGLLAVKVSETRTEFIGFHFRVETPLQVQNYQPATQCISTWALVLPPARGGLSTVREAMDVSVADFIAGAQYPYFKMGDFGSYLAGGTESEAAAVAVLSHHNKNQLYYELDDIVLSDSVNRTFAKPSLAILDGCSTGAPGAVDFIQKLNQQGMASIIITSTGVTPQLAGDFLACLAGEIRTHGGQTDYYLSNAYLNTIECLQAKPMMPGGAKYGSRALTYTLLGNGNLKLCVPKKRPQ